MPTSLALVSQPQAVTSMPTTPATPSMAVPVNPAMGVWKIGSGCTLGFVTQLANTSGLNGGAIDGMAVTPNGKYLVVAYGDGSVGSSV